MLRSLNSSNAHSSSKLTFLPMLPLVAARFHQNYGVQPSDPTLLLVVSELHNSGAQVRHSSNSGAQVYPSSNSETWVTTSERELEVGDRWG